MTLELNRLTGQVGAMSQELAARKQEYAALITTARRWLAQYADQNELLRHPAQAVHAAIPTGEPLDAVHPSPPAPERFTFIAADGSEIQPDSHGVALYYLINVGSMVYRHGSGQAPEAHSRPTVGYTEDEIYENGQPITREGLNFRRDLAEITRLAHLCTAEPAEAKTIAVVDGTLILWTLKDTPAASQKRKVNQYLRQLARIQESGAVVAAFISRPRRGEVARLLHLANEGGDVERAQERENRLQHIPDHAIFASLPPGARSALFVSPAAINQRYYTGDQRIHFFYLNMASQEDAPAVARVELPAWVANDVERTALVHSSIVAQAQITGDYPYALVRADELAFISGPEREAFEDMVTASLVRAGLHLAPSPKKYYKNLTRRGKRKY